MECKNIQVRGSSYTECVCMDDEYRTKKGTCERLNYKRNLAFKKLVLSTDIYIVDYGNFSKEKLVDGQILGESMIHLDFIPNNEVEWIIVDLEDVYEVGYVELYTRWNYKYLDRVKDLKVGLNETLELATKSKIGSYELCGIITEVRKAGLPMRITCQGKKTGRYVIIQPRTINLGLGIKELEVYEELGQELNDNSSSSNTNDASSDQPKGSIRRQSVDFIGCFEVYSATFTSSQSSLISCQDACEKFDDKKLVFALKSFRVKVRPKNINITSVYIRIGNILQNNLFLKCDTDKTISLYSGRRVFSASPIGCFKDTNLESMSGSTLNLTRKLAYASCFSYCEHHYAKHFAIKDTKCLCGYLYNAVEQICVALFAFRLTHCEEHLVDLV
ncbi:hypothetical protein HELRODRAFT_178963 [Helobdella robusta]|uniref:Apple domain-containing protein n=1 Tax=Helobdella robusta TaxID=6412 RepID=T1FDZ3_HELRO|nr:hypothetical protein HELRODRAFT_178963 [Helobdella robusta]ESN95783.1 hypothetical protein HELRODRAFT_178963 [Helobdella robusta]